MIFSVLPDSGIVNLFLRFFIKTTTIFPLFFLKLLKNNTECKYSRASAFQNLVGSGDQFPCPHAHRHACYISYMDHWYCNAPKMSSSWQFENKFLLRFEEFWVYYWFQLAMEQTLLLFLQNLCDRLFLSKNKKIKTHALLLAMASIF